MRPKQPETQETGDLFRARLDQIIDMGHELVRLADTIDWDWIDAQIADHFSDQGRPGTETRFMVGLLLKHIYPVRRGGVRALGLRPVFPALHRRGHSFSTASRMSGPG